MAANPSYENVRINYRILPHIIRVSRTFFNFLGCDLYLRQFSKMRTIRTESKPKVEN